MLKLLSIGDPSEDPDTERFDNTDNNEPAADLSLAQEAATRVSKLYGADKALMTKLAKEAGINNIMRAGDRADELGARQRVQRAAARLAGHAAAVDILVTSLTRVLQNPADEKYRTVNIQNKHFQSTVAAAPGGMEFMYAVGFEPMHGHLVLQSRDPALVWIGKSALEQLRGTSSYGASKEAQQLQQALALSKVEYETHDEVARAAFLLRVPEEPPEGAAGSTKICIHVGQEQVWRRFESCNTLEDLLNFVRSLPRAPKRDLVLDNITTRPPRRLDTAAQLGLTLQRLDMWPSGHVAVSCGA